MLTFMLPGSLAALSTQAAAVGPVARDGAQHVTPDIVLAQLDIIAAASGGAMPSRRMSGLIWMPTTWPNTTQLSVSRPSRSSGRRIWVVRHSSAA